MWASRSLSPHAARPASVGFLVFDEPLYAPPHRAMRIRHTIRRQSLEGAPRDIGARGIEHRIVIGERNLAEKFPVIIGVERGPAAIAMRCSIPRAPISR